MRSQPVPNAANVGYLFRSQDVLPLIARNKCEQSICCGVLILLRQVAELLDSLFKQLGHRTELYQTCLNYTLKCNFS